MDRNLEGKEMQQSGNYPATRLRSQSEAMRL
jgi:hypothetical protein